MIQHKRVDSPCVGNCCLDDYDVCLGCYRTLEEIKSWGVVDDEARINILNNVSQRAKQKAYSDRVSC
ncbi:MAG: DUF1289 domain-containing protein [Gammaproteobacteria bacterium HGW-Gammaproteobacteria-10]|nr:MAG: DUF1289 domain-containing protein [Gammaproteobacteria bacterium HGW-Gammaproteobacteria-10]HBA67101.1 DUF1289 domain-containing protein [Methylococcaceae bacterium]